MAYPPLPLLDIGDFGPVAPGSAKVAKPAVLSASFGGGYSQRTGDGINAMRRDFNYKSPLLRADRIQILEAFFVGLRGYMPFIFTPPYESVPRQFICPTWQTDYTDRLKSVLTATFEENFDP